MTDPVTDPREGHREPPAAGDRDRTALVLAGGGMPGWMYEIGALTALDEFFEEGFSVQNFDIYVGTSAGSAVAALLANGVKPRIVYDAILHDEPTAYNFQRKDIYAFGTGETWPMIRKFASASWAMVRDVARGIFRKGGRLSLLDILYAVQVSLPSGLFTLDPLERKLADLFRAEGMSNDFRALPVRLFIPAVDLDRGHYVIFGRPGHDKVPISRAVTASSAVPVLFQPVHIDGADYIDGGTGRVANMDVAVDEGAGLIVVINPVVHLDNDRESICLPTCYGFCRGLKEKGMAFVADQAMRVNTDMRLRIAKAQQEIMFPDVDIAIVNPDPRDTVMFTQNVMGHETRNEVLRYGYRSTVTHLVKHFDHWRAIFARRGIGVTLERFRWRPRVRGMQVLGPNERKRLAGAERFSHPEQPARG